MIKISHSTLAKGGLWFGAVGTVLAVGIICFPGEDPAIDFWQSLYYTFRLFLFEHDLSKFPDAFPLRFIYFFAPLITLSAVGTAITYIYRLSPALRVKLMSDHVIVCGVGRTGKLFAKTLKNRGIPVVGVDLGPSEEFEEWCNEHKVSMLYGDFHSQALIKAAGAERARSIIFVSGDDLANLEGTIAAYTWLYSRSGPARLIWTHIAYETLADIARSSLRTRGTWGIRFFDTYHMAASRMVANYFSLQNRRGIREIIIVGYGKFGRDLLEVLLRDAAAGEKWKIHVIDMHNRESEVFEMAEVFNIADQITFTKTSIQDLRFTNREKRAFFLCTDDDIGNLTAAVLVAGKVKNTHIYVRMAKWPIEAVSDHLSEKHGITFVNINDLVMQGMDDLPGIFEPAKPSDLKRLTAT